MKGRGTGEKGPSLSSVVGTESHEEQASCADVSERCRTVYKLAR